MRVFIHKIGVDVDTFLNVASFLLAIYSLFQSRRASQIARDVEAKIQKNRHTSDLSRLSGCLDIAIQEVKIFGPVTALERLRGIDHHKVAEKVQDFTLMLNDCMGLFKGADKQKARGVCEAVKALLIEFGDEGKTLDEVKIAGRKILNELSNFSSILKTGLNKQIEKS